MRPQRQNQHRVSKVKSVVQRPATIVAGGLTVVLTSFLVLTAPLKSATAEEQHADAAAKARAVPAKQIIAIYENRTWPWDNGAAYFGESNHKFAAWVGQGAKTAYADGSWTANDQGQLCFSGTWHSIGGNGPSTTCFEFRSDEKNIYQRKLPDGEWYIFSHLPALPNDEIKKLQPGDQIAKGYDENKRYLAEHKDDVAVNANKAHAVSGKELDAIYEDRTWPWSEGGAYFGPNHKFAAWVGKTAKSSYAEGTWSTNDQGKLCYTATWHNLAGSGPSTDCFEHRRDDNYIYQRKLPGGKWSIFSNIPAASGDEIKKLQPGDHTTGDYEKNRKYVAENTDKKRKK